jgi:uncharacterized protein YndB with AHSA1/START domain
MKTIHHVLDIDASTDSIWSAITEADGLASWWSTKVQATKPIVGERITFTFADDFNPVMEITALDEGRKLEWRCVSGHEPWNNGTFRFEVLKLDDARTKLRFWQDYAVELSDDAYGVYNFNWGYYLESLRLLCTTGTGKPFKPTSSTSMRAK